MDYFAQGSDRASRRSHSFYGRVLRREKVVSGIDGAIIRMQIIKRPIFCKERDMDILDDPEMARYVSQDLKEAISFHGHFCPGLLIGYRAAKAGMSRLGSVRSGDEELVAMVENNSCAVDAVQVLAGATFGKGNLFFKDHGKQVFTFARRPSGRAVRVALKAGALGGGGESREDKSRMLLQKPDDELFDIEEATIDLPAEAEIRKSVLCDSCGEPVMETRTREVKGRLLCIPCAEKGGA